MRHGLTQAQCEVESIFMFVAGSDTTASAIRATLLHILSTPRVYQRLKDEIKAAVNAGRVSHPITQTEARELPYLQVSEIFPWYMVNLRELMSRQIRVSSTKVCGYAR